MPRLSAPCQRARAFAHSQSSVSLGWQHLAQLLLGTTEYGLRLPCWQILHMSHCLQWNFHPTSVARIKVQSKLKCAPTHLPRIPWDKSRVWLDAVFRDFPSLSRARSWLTRSIRLAPRGRLGLFCECWSRTSRLGQKCLARNALTWHRCTLGVLHRHKDEGNRGIKGIDLFELRT